MKLRLHLQVENKSNHKSSAIDKSLIIENAWSSSNSTRSLTLIYPGVPVLRLTSNSAVSDVVNIVKQ